MTREEARRFVQAVHEESCRYGHFGCSTHRNGPCMDETLCHYPELDGTDEGVIAAITRDLTERMPR